MKPMNKDEIIESTVSKIIADDEEEETREHYREIVRTAITSYGLWLLENGKPEVYSLCSMHKDRNKECHICQRATEQQALFDEYASNLKKLIEGV